MTTIHDYVQTLQRSGMTNRDIYAHLDECVTESTISKWSNNRVEYPSLQAAIKIYKMDKVVIMPYSEEALEHLAKDEKWI